MRGEAGVRFELIQQTVSNPDNTMSVTELCDLQHVSRSGYYNWLSSEERRQERERQDQEDFDLILGVYQSHQYSRGAQGIHMGLLHQGVTMNVKKIRRLMKKFNLICPIRKANPYRRMAKALKTSNTAENLVQREFESHGPRRILLTDITYLQYSGGTAYLSTILDAFTKQILTYRVSSSLEVNFVLETLQDLIENHGKELDPETIIHSDQGCHYTRYKYIDLVKSSKLRQSMSRKGNCWDNAPQESFFGHMKDEIKKPIQHCHSSEEVEAVIDEWIRYYNNERDQWQLAKLAPNEFYKYYMTGIYPIEGVKVPATQLGSSAPSNGTTTA